MSPAAAAAGGGAGGGSKPGTKFAERLASFQRDSAQRAGGFSSAAADRMVASLGLSSSSSSSSSSVAAGVGGGMLLGAENALPQAGGECGDGTGAAPRAVKPLASLLQGDFSLAEFKEYVQIKGELPSMACGSTGGGEEVEEVEVEEVEVGGAREGRGKEEPSSGSRAEGGEAGAPQHRSQFDQGHLGMGRSPPLALAAAATALQPPLQALQHPVPDLASILSGGGARGGTNVDELE